MFKGMDVEGGRNCAQVMDARAGELDQIKAQLSQLIHAFDWKGPDADTCRQSWDGDQVRALTMVVEALRQFSTAIKKQAEEQERVSAA